MCSQRPNPSWKRSGGRAWRPTPPYNTRPRNKSLPCWAHEGRTLRGVSFGLAPGAASTASAGSPPWTTLRLRGLSSRENSGKGGQTQVGEKPRSCRSYCGSHGPGRWSRHVSGGEVSFFHCFSLCKVEISWGFLPKTCWSPCDSLRRQVLLFWVEPSMVLRVRRETA